MQGNREIAGDARFFAFVKDLVDRFAYDNVSTQEFIDFAKEASGLSGDDLALLDAYFQQWLYGEVKPTIVPEDFAAPPPRPRPRTPGGGSAGAVR